MLIQEYWNRVTRKEYPLKYREHINASDIGMSFAERYVKMHGIPVSNPYSDRTLRIFDAGKVIEFLVMRVLALAGILNKTQGWLELPATKEHLKVLGRLDATIGGFSSWEDAEKVVGENLKKYSLDIDDDLLAQKAAVILQGLKQDHPEGWKEEMMVEVKSVNSMVFWKHSNRDAMGRFKGFDNNKLQLYAYLAMSNMRQGILLYVSKDDFTLAEVPVMLEDQDLKRAFYQDICTMTDFHRSNTMPPLDDEIVYNDQKGVFEINWNVSRSTYLTYLYGYATPEELEAKHHQHLLDMNRALRHLRTGKVKTNDLSLIKEYNLEQYIDRIEEKEEDEDD